MNKKLNFRNLVSTIDWNKWQRLNQYTPNVQHSLCIFNYTTLEQQKNSFFYMLYMQFECRFLEIVEVCIIKRFYWLCILRRKAPSLFLFDKHRRKTYEVRPFLTHKITWELRQPNIIYAVKLCVHIIIVL